LTARLPDLMITSTASLAMARWAWPCCRNSGKFCPGGCRAQTCEVKLAVTVLLLCHTSCGSDTLATISACSMQAIVASCRGQNQWSRAGRPPGTEQPGRWIFEETNSDPCSAASVPARSGLVC
jgi:hypothetical protein